MQQSTLFDSEQAPADTPLAEKIRPRQLTELIGQDKLLKPDAPLRLMIDRDTLSSFILWGPPGTGKTSLARIVEGNSSLPFYCFSAVLSKISDVKQLMARADLQHRQKNRATIVFIDEIHRFNKAQQDAFLPYVESGAVVLIGATTENPSFEIIPALLSRCHVFVLEPLSKDHLLAILTRATERLYKQQTFTPEALEALAACGAGDARKSLNDLELISRHADSGATITADFVAGAINKSTLFYDKRGEQHFNLISALQKSIRGSDPQAALYWLARMVEAGEDPMYITRRLVRIASEDIGLADPQAIVQAMAVKEATHFLGMPEANTALSQLVVYLACAPKSNSLETAYHRAAEDATRTSHLSVPRAICNAPTKLMVSLGYSSGYQYSHDFDNHYRYQRYFPDQMQEKTYYTPGKFGFEKEIDKRMQWWDALRKRQKTDEDDD